MLLVGRSIFTLNNFKRNGNFLSLRKKFVVLHNFFNLLRYQYKYKAYTKV